MFRVHCLLPRPDAERLSDIIAEMDPSPASAVSVEEASRVAWSLDAFCVDEGDPTGVYVGTRDGCVYASADEGDTFTLVADHLPDVLAGRAARLP